MIHHLPEIRHDQTGFEALVCLKAETENCVIDCIEIDMSRTSWFDADMCSPLGAVLYRLGKKLNTINLTNISPNVETILSRNGFLSSYGREKLSDMWGTTISYQRLDAKDDRYFAGYVERELIKRSEMPAMSLELQKKFRESIFEIFSNAVIHSQTKMGIFSCGQFFRKRNRLVFSVADLGVGIRQNVAEHAGLRLTSEAAIEWATQGCNTTKNGPIPGGLGLKLLIEFIDLNGGRIQIVSDAGYWTREKRNTITAPLSRSFPGTVVNLEIDTADTKSYALTSEISEDDIF